MISSSAEKKAPPGLDAQALQRVAPEQLAGAIDVGDLQAEEDAVGQAVQPRVDRADQGIGALDAEAHDDVRVVGPGEALGQAAEIRDTELAIAVGEGDELVAGSPEARAERGAVAEVRRVVDDADEIGVRGGQLVGDRPRPIAGTVVDGDDLEGVRQPGQRLQRLLDEPGEVGLLVVGREEVREARDARGHVASSRRPTTRDRLSGMGIGTGSMTNSSSSSAPVVEADHVDRTLAEIAVDDVRGAPQVLVEARPIIDDVDAREPPLDVLSIP